MSPPTRTYLLSFLLVVSLSLAQPTTALGGDSHDQKIIWMDAKDHSQVMFVPERLLNEKELTDLPLTEQNRSYLQGAMGRLEYVEEYRKRTGRTQEPLCPDVNVSPRWRDASSLQELLQKEPLSFFATIEEVVPGYSFLRFSPVSMVYLKPENVLRGDASSLQGAKSLLYLEPWGSIVIKGNPVCWKPPSGFYRARRGDRVLVVGSQFRANPEVLVDNYVFPVSGGAVYPQPFPAVKDFEPIPVKALQVNEVGQ
jgi:hypothetical protein